MAARFVDVLESEIDHQCNYTKTGGEVNIGKIVTEANSTFAATHVAFGDLFLNSNNKG